MCEYQTGSWYQPAGFPWWVQRVWSNRAASLGTQPCVPPATPDYAYAAPDLTDSLTVTLESTPESAATVQIAVGGTKAIDVHVVGGQPTVPIEVEAMDGVFYASGAMPHLSLTLDRTVALPGDTLHLTIEKLSADPYYGAEPFVLLARQDGRTSLFWGMTSE
jgi:hypothetical protein